MNYFKSICCEALRFWTLGAISAALIVPLSAASVPISTLHSTGSGSQQGADAYYSILQDPTGSGQIAYITDNTGFPFGAWFANDAFSSWISPLPSYTGGGADGVGDYVYRTTFDLSGLSASTATIQLQIAADNSLRAVVLNGVSTPFSYSSFAEFSTPLTISSGFLSGVNTLDFVTYNGGGPGGLRVQASGTADSLSPSPEPATAILLGSAFAFAGLIRFRKK